MQFLKLKSSWIDDSKIKVLCIQGPSTAGKTYLSTKVQRLLTEHNKNTMVINLDDFYLPRPQEAVKYDFDNPAALNWAAIFALIKDINDKKDYLYFYKYSYEGSLSHGPIKVKNTFPEYLIIDGIYSLYIFSSFFFDLEKYDPQKETLPLFKKSLNNFNNLAVINILLTTCKEKMLKTRINRDLKERGKELEMIIHQVENEAWPASLKWVLNDKLKVDFCFWHGTFNEIQVETFISSLKCFITEEVSYNKVTEAFFCCDCGKKETDFIKSIKLTNKK